MRSKEARGRPISNGARRFWETYANTSESDASAMNLEPDESLALRKFLIEKEHVFKVAEFNETDVVLDLGAGVGMWSLEIAPRVRKVIAVEYQEQFCARMQQKLDEANYGNLSIIHQAVERYVCSERVSKTLMSGITLYLDDDVLLGVLRRQYRCLSRSGLIIHRDSYGLNSTKKILGEYSEALKLNYSAYYRTRETYDELFREAGFEKIYDQDMFDSGSIFNKWSDTRLRVAKYRKF